MSNKTAEKTNKENSVAKEVDHKAKWKEARENVVIQLKEHSEKAEFHKTMATKAQGVIEVNDQLFSEENNEN
jgi:hypothetical protein